MPWSGSSPLAAVRDGMWGLLLFAGVAWLAIGWSVLRLEPADIVRAAGPVILFGALTEAVRACAGARTWWLNAGMAVLFLATGVALLAGRDSSYTTPAALVGWYLMVRGALDVAVAMMTRETDRIWGLLMVVGVLEAGLGFFAASPLSRTADLMVVVLGAVGLLRGVADLVAGLRLREVRAARADTLELPPERALGLTGYSAGMADYESAPARGGPRHRAQPPSGEAGAMWPSGPAAGAVAGGVTAGGMAAAGYVAADGPGPSGDTFHEEVLRTTADLDAMLALAGVTGAGVGSHLEHPDLPAVPDTPEGAELPEGAESPSGEQPPDDVDQVDDGGLTILDPTAH